MCRVQLVETPLYLKLANTIESQIREGTLRVGERLPSIRALREQRGVSVSTVLQAYMWLENRGCVEARPQSGFYVRVPYSDMAPEPNYRAERATPTAVSVGDVVIAVMKSASDRDKIPFGAASASPELLPGGRLGKYVQSITRQDPQHSARYEMPPGNADLRRQIARRSLAFGCSFSPAEVLITCGAMEAVNLALRAVARAGDVIALESPTYFGVLQAIESLGLKTVEIPTHPRLGMDLDSLHQAIRKHKVRAMVVMANCHNPLGYVLPDQQKKALVELSAKYDVAIIEDDIYGDLTFDGRRPKATKAFDRKGLVLMCSSFSKVLAPGYRVGWIHAGRFRDEVERLKLVSTLATANLPQMVVARFLESGNYDRHLRRLRTAFVDQIQTVSKAVAKYFPEGTRISRPQGGHVLWVELPKRVDALALYRRALAENITISPGPMFSPSGRFRHHIRLNCGQRWSDTLDRALLTLGRLCDK